MLNRHADDGSMADHHEHGAVATEYAIMASLIAVVIVGAVTLIGVDVNAMFAPLIGGF